MFAMVELDNCWHEMSIQTGIFHAVLLVTSGVLFHLHSKIEVMAQSKSFQIGDTSQPVSV